MKVPYPMVAAVDTYRRHAQMSVAVLDYNFERLKEKPIDNMASLSIACYGPSLADTYKSMTRPIMSMSGATKFLAERGIIPDYHVDMDPRQRKVEDFKPLVPGVHYLIASVCHPDVFKALVGQRVSLWHTYSSEETYKWVNSLDSGQLVIRGGSTIGLTALHLAGVMGYRHFEIHGMDGSFKDHTRTERHAGPHPDKQNKDKITWDAGGVTYPTSKIMANAVTETLSCMRGFPIFCVFHGNGLTQALIRENNFPNACCADETEKAARIRRSTATVLDKIVVNPAKGETPGSSAWDVLYGCPAQMLPKDTVNSIFQKTEPRRAAAKYNTGTITVDQMAQLRAISTAHQSKRIAEIGTFIGNSTESLVATEMLYTCDRDNDCLMPTERITTFAYQESTEMLGSLVEQKQQIGLFFFDGRIQPPDLPLILRLSHKDTIYLFDDYRQGEKGKVNVERLTSVLPQSSWILLEPDARLETSMAAIVPNSIFRSTS